MRSDRLTFVYGPLRQHTSALSRTCTGTRTPTTSVGNLVRSMTAAISSLLVVAMLTGCSNAQVRRTPVTDLGEAWFCEMNESRDDWICVQDEALARNPQPARLPSDPVEPDPFEEDIPALPEVATSTQGLANPGAAINFDAIAAATIRPDAVTAILDRSPEHFAVQLAATETQALADGFIANHDLDSYENLVTLELARDEAFYYVVLLDVFDTFEEAEAAVSTLPESFAEVQAWIRPLASIQSGIEDAEALHMGLSN